MDVTEGMGEMREGLDGSRSLTGPGTAPKEIFVVLLQDRHSDPEVTTFSDRDVAISYARAMAKEMCRNPEDYEEQAIKGWEFFAQYSCESDSVTVLATTLDGEVQ